MHVCFKRLARDKYNACIFVAIKPNFMWAQILRNQTTWGLWVKRFGKYPHMCFLRVMKEYCNYQNILNISNYFPVYQNISVCSKNIQILEHILMCACWECEVGYCSGITQLSLLGTLLPSYQDISHVTRALKMAIILPTGQWYAPSVVKMMHGIAWYCMVLHCIA